jgi:Protein of unknown function (DUF2695)
MTQALPISYDALRDLFEHLDRASMTGYECDHTYSLTTSFLSGRGFSPEVMLAWLGENGAGCDCEIMLNVAQRWEDTVGYVPPDAPDE